MKDVLRRLRSGKGLRLRVGTTQVAGCNSGRIAGFTGFRARSPLLEGENIPARACRDLSHGRLMAAKEIWLKLTLDPTPTHAKARVPGTRNTVHLMIC